MLCGNEERGEKQGGGWGTTIALVVMGVSRPIVGQYERRSVNEGEKLFINIYDGFLRTTRDGRTSMIYGCRRPLKPSLIRRSTGMAVILSRLRR